MRCFTPTKKTKIGMAKEDGASPLGLLVGVNKNDILSHM
jgi:hypothetical protein